MAGAGSEPSSHTVESHKGTRLLFSKLSVLLVSLFLIGCLWLERGEAARSRMERSLMTFKERKDNSTFLCSPAGPCVPCQYSEKNDEKFRCSETGYRIPLRCVEEEIVSKGAKSRQNESISEGDAKLTQDHQNTQLLEDPDILEKKEKNYISYRSCIPAANEEKLSVLGFEGIMLCLLLVSVPVVYMRKRSSAAVFGAGTRQPVNSRF